MLPRPCVSANTVIFGGVIIFFGGVTPAEGRYSPARAVRLSSTARGMEYIRTLAPNRSLRCWSHSRSSQQPDARLTPPNHHWEDGILGRQYWRPFLTSSQKKGRGKEEEKEEKRRRKEEEKKGGEEGERKEGGKREDRQRSNLCSKNWIFKTLFW